VDSANARDVSAQAASPSHVSAAIAEIHRHLPGLPLSRQNALYLRCDDLEWLVLLSGQKQGPKTPSGLARQKAFLGAAAVRFEAENKEWSPRYFILTQPGSAEGQVEVLLANTRGRLDLAGSGQVNDERLEFSLRALAKPGAVPVEISGAYETGVLRLEHILAARTRLPPILLRPE
jgi:hypothetical protein